MSSSCSAQLVSAMEDLPNELLQLIFSFLPVQDLYTSVALVCRRWWYLTSSDYVWLARFFADQASWRIFASFNVKHHSTATLTNSKSISCSTSASIPPSCPFSNEQMIDLLQPILARVTPEMIAEEQTIRESHERLYALGAPPSSSSSSSSSNTLTTDQTATTHARSQLTRYASRLLFQSSKKSRRLASDASPSVNTTSSSPLSLSSSTSTSTSPPHTTDGAQSRLWQSYYLYQYRINKLFGSLQDDGPQLSWRGALSPATSPTTSPPTSPPMSPPKSRATPSGKSKKKSSRKERLDPERVWRILLFGEGLDSSAKRLIYQMMWAPDSPFSISKLYKVCVRACERARERERECVSVR
jgi:hypothetical protein